MRAARFTGYNHGICFNRLNTPPSGLTIWQPLLHGMDRVSNDPDILNSNETHPNNFIGSNWQSLSWTRQSVIHKMGGKGEIK